VNQLERHNLAQIEALNQRGGRMLSVVDLLDAGTIDLDMAAFLGGLVARGASFLTGAVPGGAGKTTVMAALLGFLPPGVEIVTVEDEGAIAGAPAAAKRRQCHIAHEIGSGQYYGYIWGRTVGDYLDLIRQGHMIASNLHADTLPQLRQVLLSPPMRVGEDALAALGFVLFVAAERRRSQVIRRVSAVHASAASGAPLLCHWDRSSDTFHADAGLDRYVPQAERTALAAFLQILLDRGVRRLEDVRSAYLHFLADAEPRP
jgi:hypothetical protein